MKPARIIIIITICLNSYLAKGQTHAELDELRSGIQPRKHTHVELASENKNEIEMLFSGLFLFYKTFISSQDNSSCSFSPSCSEYGIIAVKKKGIVKGMLSTFDRLTRCNGLNRKKYPIDPATGLLIDPV